MTPNETTDTPMPEAPPLPKKRKHDHNPKPKNKGIEHHSLTISTPPYTYIHLTLLTTPPTAIQLDDITAKTHLTSALTQFLGLTGSAIAVDLLKTEGKDVWIRVMREDAGVLVAAVGGWVREMEGGRMGWRVVGRGNWLAGLVGSGDVWG